VGNPAQDIRVLGSAAVHKDEANSRKKQEPAESIGGNDVKLHGSVHQDQDDDPAIQEHRGKPKELRIKNSMTKRKMMAA
jgi:hypothetical protein